MRFAKLVIISTAFLAAFSTLFAQQQQHQPRARDLGVPFEGTPGPLDSTSRSATKL